MWESTEDTVANHAEILDRAGYDIAPANIEPNFSRDLTPTQLLFRRIFDVAVGLEPAENSPAGNIRTWLERQADLQQGLAEAVRDLANKGLSFGQNGALGGALFTMKKVMTRLGK
jgi:hypothetical protein